jgi:glycosyltransferase involved in cell wall biosynthesis
LKLGIVANEFFDPALGRMGGFGWAARQVARCFSEDPSLGVEVTFFSREHRGEEDLLSHGRPLIPIHASRWSYRARVRREKVDLLLSIDYRRAYRALFMYLPRTPLIVWARDPRSDRDQIRAAAIRIPGQEDAPPAGVRSPDTTSLRHVARASQVLRRPFALAHTDDFLLERIPGAYALSAKRSMPLPNIIDLEPVGRLRYRKPTVAFLGRLDPIKRPWVLAELAERLPHVDFLVMGADYQPDQGGWRPESLPSNLHLLGHKGEAEKAEILSQSWLAANTSVHEGLAISLLEALRCETPLVASVDPGNVVSRFGRYVGDFPGTGMESVPAFLEAINELIGDDDLRNQLGREGRDWVEVHHSRDAFLAGFERLCGTLGVRWTKAP